jgi:hypothetical protein
MIPKNILKSFNLEGEPIPVEGGQNTSVKVHNAILKPVEEKEYYEWSLKLIDNITPISYRISKPYKNKSGSYVSSNWICNRYESGNEVDGSIEKKLKVSRLFHQDLSKFEINDFPEPNNPWAKGHRISWQVEPLPSEFTMISKEIINELLLMIRLKRHYNVQIIHGDLSGNILFDDRYDPLIIDFSPTIAPVEYAEAILVCDCIAWQGSNISELNLLPNNELYREMMIRAVIFRLSVKAILSGKDENSFLREYDAFKPIIDQLSM